MGHHQKYRGTVGFEDCPRPKARRAPILYSLWMENCNRRPLKPGRSNRLGLDYGTVWQELNKNRATASDDPHSCAQHHNQAQATMNALSARSGTAAGQARPGWTRLDYVEHPFPDSGRRGRWTTALLWLLEITLREPLACQKSPRNAMPQAARFVASSFTRSSACPAKHAVIVREVPHAKGYQRRRDLKRADEACDGCPCCLFPKVILCKRLNISWVAGRSLCLACQNSRV